MNDIPVTLQDGIAALGLALPEDAPQKLLAYRDLLLKWNRAYNLTAIKTPEAIVTHHLLDSLAVLPWLDRALNDMPPGSALLDVGSGAGLPGIPLAIARPEIRLTLIDAVQKKTVFLRQAAIELGLSQVDVRHVRAEEFVGRYAVIVARALTQLPDFIALTRHLIAPDGYWLAMKGQYPAEELAKLPADIQIAAVEPLKTPGLAAERHLALLRLRK
jgi:16S rRNA (guanine527-N7)-methyltransferase